LKHSQRSGRDLLCQYDLHRAPKGFLYRDATAAADSSSQRMGLDRF
jgi:hypothetical protein